MLIARGGRVVLDRGYGTIRPDGGAPHRAGERWRLASITKQVVTTLLLRDHADALDQPVAVGGTAPTLRQLLTHRSGLPDPDATAMDEAAVPAFYTRAAPDLGYCRGAPVSPPGGVFRYNNCDYLIAAARYPRSLVWFAGMAMARHGEQGIAGFVRGRREPAFALTSFGAAGGLIGTARASWRFDRALMTARALPPAARALLWTPEGQGRAQAIGQRVFSTTLRGCTAPTRIVQRDGEIMGTQARNYILPDTDAVVIVFTTASDDFVIGNVWQRSGFAFDLLSAVACG